MLDMSDWAWYIFISSVKLCCLLCLCSFALLVSYEGSMTLNYDLYMTAISLNEISQSVLLIGVLSSFCVELIQS